MSAAYRLEANAAQIAQSLRADAAGDVWAGGQISPASYAPVVVSTRERGRHLAPRLWGVPPPPNARDPYVVPFVRNLDSPFWIGNLRHTQFRCLVPMTGFWQRGEWFTATDQPIFACAGLWRDSEIPSFAIITSGEGQAMPLLLTPETYDIWLHADFKLARKLVESVAPA